MVHKKPNSDAIESHTSATIDWEDEVEQQEFKPLTREEAQQWRARQPETSVWRVVMWQAVLSVLVSLIAWAVTQRGSVGWSALYGGLCITLPSALMAYGLVSSPLSRALAVVFPGVAKVSLVGVLFWEGVKVILALVMMWLAPRFVPDLSWLALVAGLVVALKAYWVELWIRSRAAR